MNLPEKLAFLRRAKGLSQEKLADEMNVSRQAVSKWESGNVMPSLDNLIYLSKLYGVPIDSLIDDSQDLPPEPAPPEPVPPESHGGTPGFHVHKEIWLAYRFCPGFDRDVHPGYLYFENTESGR